MGHGLTGRQKLASEGIAKRPRTSERFEIHALRPRRLTPQADGSARFETYRPSHLRSSRRRGATRRRDEE